MQKKSGKGLAGSGKAKIEKNRRPANEPECTKYVKIYKKGVLGNLFYSSLEYKRLETSL